MVVSEKVSIPQIQHPDRVVNQIQQNFVTAFNALQRSLLNQTTAIGDIRESGLTVDQFQTFYGTTDWVLADGSSAIGSGYQRLTGNTTVPTKANGATNYFVRIN